MRLVATIACQSSKATSSNGAGRPNDPALLNSTSTRPNSSRTRANRAATASRSATSVGTAIARSRRPGAGERLAQRLLAGARRAPRGSRRPAARASTARPSPDPAPGDDGDAIVFGHRARLSQWQNDRPSRMLLLHRGLAARRWRRAGARRRAARAPTSAEPDELGVFEVALEADDREDALSACGTPSRPRAPTTTSSSSSTPSCPSTGATAAGARRLTRGRSGQRSCPAKS